MSHKWIRFMACDLIWAQLRGQRSDFRAAWPAAAVEIEQVGDSVAMRSLWNQQLSQGSHRSIRSGYHEYHDTM